MLSRVIKAWGCHCFLLWASDYKVLVIRGVCWSGVQQVVKAQPLNDTAWRETILLADGGGCLAHVSLLQFLRLGNGDTSTYSIYLRVM